MLKKLANINIGKKLTLAFGAMICVSLCLTGLGLWSVRSVHSAMESSQREGHIMTVIEKVSADQGAIAQRVATMTLAGEAGTEIMSQLLLIRKRYMKSLDELKQFQDTPEGQRLLERVAGAAAEWRDADNRLIAMLQSHKPVDAVKFHQTEVVPRFNANGDTIANYRQYREQLLAKINEDAKALVSNSTAILIGGGVIFLAAILVFGLLLARSITTPLRAAMTHLHEVAEGDLRRDTPPEIQARGDEIGLLAKAQQAMILNLRQTVQDILSGVHVLSSSSSELSASSIQMANGSEQASNQSHAVAAAAEQMTANVTCVAAGMEQATANLTSIVSATEQMTAVIGDIAGNSEKARRITGEANRQTAHIKEQMDHLRVAAKEIDKVTETINDISSQTNLLALNATIEAARAGSVGKGFAVVANEIKELAQQTAAATEDIKRRIVSVQSSTMNGIAEIDKVSHIIREITDIVSSIAAAIEEQSVVTKDIARNISEASIGVKEANRRVSETTLASAEIAKDIVAVDQMASRMADGSSQIQNSATALSKMSEQLQTTVFRFRVG